MASTEEVSRAVRALYGADAQQQAEANRWLMAFAETPGAWDVCHELVMRGPSQEITFFGANVLHTKVRREWLGLADEGRSQAYAALTALVLDAVRREQSSGMLTCRRLCLALGAAAAQQSAVVGPCVSMALSLGSAANGAQGAVAAFALLAAIPDEMEQLDRAGGGGGGGPPSASAPARAHELDLRPFVSTVARLVEAHVVPAERITQSTEVRCAALGCLGAWTCASPASLSLRALASQHAPLLEALMDALASDETVEVAADALCEACSLEVLTLSLAPEDVHLAATMASLFLRLRPQLAAAVESDGDDWAIAFTRALGQFAACAAQPLACASAGGDTQAAQLQQLVLLCLECMRHPSLRVTENLVDVWVTLQDVPMRARAEAMRGPLYERLLQAILERCMWPLDDDGAVDADADDGTFDKWRQQTANEVLTCCLGALGAGAFAAALSTLLPAEPPAAAEGWARVWRQVEVVAFAVSAVHIELKARLRAAPPPSAPPTTPTDGGQAASASSPTPQLSAANALVLDKAAIDTLLGQLFALATSLPQLAAATGSGGGDSACGLAAVVEPHALTSVVLVVGLFGQWLAVHTDVLEPALSFVLAVAGSDAPVAGAGGGASAGRAMPLGGRACARLPLCAAEAFRNVCAHCERYLALAPLASGERLLDALVRAVRALLGGGARLALADSGAETGVDARVPLAEGLGRLVARLGATDSAGATCALRALVSTPALSLHTLLAPADGGGGGGGARPLSAEACAAIACELHLVTATVRFCDGGESAKLSLRLSAGAPHSSIGALLSALSELWPLLERIAHASAGSVAVVDALLELLCRCLTCARLHLLPQLPSILALAADAFAATRALGALSLCECAVEVFGAEVERGAPAGGSRLGESAEGVRAALARALAALFGASFAPVLAAPHALAAGRLGFHHQLHPHGGAAAASAAAAAEAEPELLVKAFGLAHRVAFFSPHLLVELPAAPSEAGSLAQVVDACSRCLLHQEHTHARAAAKFACVLFESPLFAEGATARRGQTGRALALLPAELRHAYGAQVLASCLLGLIGASPENLLDHQCELVRVLLETAHEQTASAWLHSAFQLEPIRAAAAPAGAEGVSLFVQLLTHRPALQLDQIAREFAHVCRRKGGIDGLRQFVPRSS